MANAEKHTPRKPHGGGPHGGGHEEVHEGAPEWIISFADNTALIMGFFVIMLALNMVPKGGGSGDAEGKDSSAAGLDWALDVREAFHNPVRLDSTDPRDRLLVERLKQRAAGDAMDKGIPGDKQRVQALAPTDRYAMSGAVLFADDSPQFVPEATDALTAIANRMRGQRLVVELRGHVSAAEAVRQNDQGIQLSFDRALTVARFLVEQGLEWQQLRMIACGDNARVKENAYQASDHRPNQRVEVVVTDELVK